MNVPRPERKCAPLGEVLREVLEGLEKSDLRKCGKIFLHWKDVVGGPLAQHARPLRVRAKKLTVTVDSSDWLYEITNHLHGKILEAVQLLVGSETIREIVYQVGEV